jgi:hypothetical protein
MNLAKLALNVRPEKVLQADLPPVLQACPGSVYRLNEQVLEPASLLKVLQARNAPHILSYHPERMQLDVTDCYVGIVLHHQSREPLKFTCPNVVLAAGSGNATLRERLGLNPQSMQRRPLHMVALRGALPALNGHCTDMADRTRLTVTTSNWNGQMVWQVGGQVAEDGVGLSQTELLRQTKRELLAVLPGLDLGAVEWTSYRVDRAEPFTSSGRRPDDAFCCREGSVLTVWPTKLALAPRLSMLIQRELSKPEAPALPLEDLKDWPRPQVAAFPWDVSDETEQGTWKRLP